MTHRKSQRKKMGVHPRELAAFEVQQTFLRYIDLNLYTFAICDLRFVIGRGIAAASRWWNSNPRPLDYESSALPLSYTGKSEPELSAECSGSQGFSHRRMCN
jgi:hypothetical protein